MSGPRGDWSSAPVREPGHVDDTALGREVRHTSGTPAAGGAVGRVHGTPAPEYGEYAPDGWVNPVLVEQERREAEERERAARAEPTPSPRATPGRVHGQRQDGRTTGTALPTSRYGASQFDFVMTVGLLAFGLFSVVQALAVTEVASAVRQAFEQQGLQLSDPGALSTAAVVGAISSVVVFALVAWWSLRRLRARRWTFWVPLLGGAVASLISLVAFVVVMFQDPGFMQALLQQSGA
ncbi:hypothetical protein DEJ23_09550 [Curtobacterium sp. MCSS17_008]|uniref:DUF6264 family protein n=1 Tax=Curtobacterium sp. MCSS17_008 TaxID=2175647 RepID=UPI000DAA6FD0|nr:DUF6264 family protein [Curtobacterium sp. MCSS17_008]PZF56781.1 hypothetical protein DEJ23_09550 [Curtobacterium sp. MCSS17_008]